MARCGRKLRSQFFALGRSSSTFFLESIDSVNKLQPINFTMRATKFEINIFLGTIFQTPDSFERANSILNLVYYAANHK